MTALVGSIQLARKTEAEWTTGNPILLDGQYAISSDTTPINKRKCGDGTTHWVDLEYEISETSNEFTELTGLVWNGSNKYIVLSEDLDLTLISILDSGKLYIRQNEIGGYAITINGNAFTINTDASGSTMLSYDAAYGYYVFDVDPNPVIMIIPAVDVDGPIVVSADKYDLNTIRMVFDEISYGTSAGFTFTRSGIDLTITGVTGSGTATWDFSILEDIENAQTVTWDYDQNTGDVEDFSGNLMETQGGNVTIPTTLYLSAEDGVSQSINAYGFGSSLEILNVHPDSKIIRSGLAQTITFNCLNTGGSVVNYLFKVWRRNSGTGLYSQVGSNIVIPRASLVLGIHTYNIPTPFNVQVGDYIGFAYSGAGVAMLCNTESGAPGAIYSIVGSVLPEGTTNYNWEAEYGLNTKYSLIQLIQI